MAVLQDLSNELVNRIIHYLPSKDICNLRLINRHLNEIAQRSLFLHISIDDMNVDSITSAMDANPHIVEHVRRLESRCGDPRLYVKVLALMYRCPMLKELDIDLASLPDENPFLLALDEARWQSKYHFINKLRSCSMRYEHFIDERFSYLFLHPGLESLTFLGSCFDSWYFVPTQTDIGSTPLQHLALLECEIQIEPLERILKLPRALKSFKLSDRYDVPDDFYGIPLPFNTGLSSTDFGQSRALDPYDYSLPIGYLIEFLSTHSRSLESLYLRRDIRAREMKQNAVFTSSDGADLSNFPTLQKLDIDLDTLFGTFQNPDRAIELVQDPWPDISHFLPPNLRELSLRFCLNAKGGNEATYVILGNVANDLIKGQIPSLHQLELCEIRRSSGWIHVGDPVGFEFEDVPNWRTLFKRPGLEVSVSIENIGTGGGFFE